jgi:hypothetical protein
MISFDVKGGAECADATVAAAQLIIRATSLGGVESSFERRAKYSSEQGVAGPGLIRFSVGLEDAVDIWLDLSFSLAEGQRRRCAVRLGKEAWKTSLIACEPAAQVQSGDIVEFVTSDDNYEKLSRGERVDLETVNVVTGPVKICDAQVGDAIRVDVLDVKIHRCWSVWSSDKKCCGCLAAKRAAAGHEKASVRELGIRDKFVVISERLQVPLRPMIGVIATASKDPKLASTFEPTYPNGGNMDLRQLVKKGFFDLRMSLLNETFFCRSLVQAFFFRSWLTVVFCLLEICMPQWEKESPHGSALRVQELQFCVCRWFATLLCLSLDCCYQTIELSSLRSLLVRA